MKIPLLMGPVREEDLSGREFLKREEGNMTEVQRQDIAAYLNGASAQKKEDEE